MAEEKPTRNQNFNARLLPDGYVLLYSETSDWVHTLTPLGGIVWEFLDGEHTAEEIADLIRSNAEIESSPDDVSKLLEDLKQKGLLGSK